MRQILSIAPSIKQKQSYSENMHNSLSILSSSNFDIAKELKNALLSNPFLQFNHTSDVDINYFDSILTNTPNIRDDLMSQVRTTRKQVNLSICSYIIQSLDSHGFFKESIEETAKLFSSTIECVYDCISLIHNLQPFGVATKNSYDFMLLQLKTRGELLCHKLLLNYQTEIENSDYTAITRGLCITMNELHDLMNTLRTCTIFPYVENTDQSMQSIIPDLKISVSDYEVDVEVVEMFKIEVAQMNVKKLSLESKRYLNEAKNFMNNLNFRNLNLLLVANYLFSYQRQFYLSGEPLKKCTLSDLSQRLSLHTSTISRIVNNKFFEYENKYFPLSFLLCKGVNDTSTKKVEELIIDIIKQESSSSPFSDDTISKKLNAMGISVARRTIAKYRNNLNIPNCKNRMIIKP